jgi:hypothetical protein
MSVESIRPNMSAVRANKAAVLVGPASPPPRPSLPTQPEGLEDAIALFATGLRILLNLESQQDREYQPPRSTDMAAESPAVNGNDRYDVLIVEKYEDETGAEKSSWTRVGVAFPHRDGNGLNVELKAIPVSGKLVIRRHEAKSRANEA